MAVPAAGVSLEDKRGDHAPTARRECHISRGELRPQAPLGHQGRAARRGTRARLLDARHLRRHDDDPSVIGSGPTVPIRRRLRTRCESWSAAAACRRYPSRRFAPGGGTRGDVPETPKPGDAAFAGRLVPVIGRAPTPCRAAPPPRATRATSLSCTMMPSWARRGWPRPVLTRSAPVHTRRTAAVRHLVWRDDRHRDRGTDAADGTRSLRSRSRRGSPRPDVPPSSPASAPTASTDRPTPPERSCRRRYCGRVRARARPAGVS